MKFTSKELETLLTQMVPVFYKGAGACGEFCFAEGKPFTTHTFHSLAEAVAEFGSRIKIESNSITSPPHHAGFNAAIGKMEHNPQTRVSDGAPRPLTSTEEREYDMGYIEGILNLSDTAP